MALRTIHCCSLPKGCLERLLSAVDELNAQLSQYYPEVPGIAGEPLAAELTSSVDSHLLRNMPGDATDDEDQHPDLQGKRLLILLPEEHPFVGIARQDNPQAVWGIAVPGRFSVAWVDNKYLWWHEALHLLNAKDCYNKFGIHKCREARCIMQAAPTHGSCGGRLHLCSKNLRRIATLAFET